MLHPERIIIFLIVLLPCLYFQHVERLKETDEESKLRTAFNFIHMFTAQILMFVLTVFLGLNFIELSEAFDIGFFFSFDFSWWVELALTFVVLDFAIYVEHYFSHHIDVFWKIHRMHHSDKMLTTSTALRFHFLEILLSALWKGLFVVLLGVRLEYLIAFEIYVNACALFHHSNIKIPRHINERLEKFIITPRLHRVHHSTDLRLTHSNFGFSVVLWDKLFKTFKRGRLVKEVGVEDLHMESIKSQLLLKNDW